LSKASVVAGLGVYGSPQQRSVDEDHARLVSQYRVCLDAIVSADADEATAADDHRSSPGTELAWGRRSVCRRER
jgi:hypothetical protein